MTFWHDILQKIESWLFESHNKIIKTLLPIKFVWIFTIKGVEKIQKTCMKYGVYKFKNLVI